MIDCLLTIGGYGFTADMFFRRLIDAKVDLFCDVRQRRGMRGSAFAFLNSARLQRRLQELEITYAHLGAFAPTTAIRDRQKEADAGLGVLKRSRATLGEQFVDGYKKEILGAHQPEDFFSQLPPGTRRPCLFCVERAPQACHRSLLADWLVSGTGLNVVNLQP